MHYLAFIGQKSIFHIKIQRQKYNILLSLKFKNIINQMSSNELLNEQSRVKSLKILQLENIVKAQQGLLRQKDDRILSLQTLLRERTQKIHKMSINSLQMEEEQIEYRSLRTARREQETLIQQLKQIIILQEEEIKSYLHDQSQYVEFLEHTYSQSGAWFDEKTLLYEYKEQLQSQIREIEDTNQTLIVASEHHLQEIHQQNEQGNDLLGQIQYMIECCEGVA